MVNAIPHKLLKRASFSQCPPPPGSNTPLPKLEVSISPDPPVAGQKVKFSVSGKFSKDITEQTKLGVAFVDTNQNPIEPPTVVDACTGSGCPIKAGDSYNQTAEVPVPDTLPNQYIIGVAVGDSESEGLGCAYTLVK
ncbi:10292_t:CDS:1 [Funneliformis geosporum]|uniref:Phosphatidylglycerol/phosphatidylinositol transfer protein n=1 Tax=Funneliformis geosporum TaxID=1117311 RepID=A0A9W4SM61_9GLOM|nr:18950_t:CDS:1 [Funneliformis geosporum]CAI2182748.1 10292_t:CDS:1 [Funneliformis geosporum]